MTYLPAESQATEPDPHALAKHAICLLEKRIHAEFGLRLCMGAELEFSLLPRSKVAYLIEPIAYKDLYKEYAKQEGFAPAKDRPIRANGFSFAKKAPISYFRISIQASDPLLPNSPVVCYSYREENPNKYEVVLSHEAHSSLPPDGRRALTFARSIEALRHTFGSAYDATQRVHEKSGRPVRRFAKDENHNDILVQMAKDYKPTFEGVSSNNTYTHGLHLNISFMDNKGKPILLDKKAIFDGIGGTMNEGTYLMLPDATAKDRFFSRCQDENYLIGNKKYIELRSPSANSDPYYATMVMLAGAYFTLSKGQFNQSTGSLDKLGSVPSFTKLTLPSLTISTSINAHFAKCFFNGDRRILSILNEMEAGLGDKFEQAIKRFPPDQVQAKQIQQSVSR